MLLNLGEFFLKYNVLLNLVLTFTGGIIGYWIKNYLDKKKELTSEITKERRESYQKFINLIISLFATIKAEKNGKNKNNDFVEGLYEFYKKNILYASPEVINSFSDYMQYMYKNEVDKQNLTVHLKLLTRVMKGMRKDLGLNNKGLGNNGEILMKAIIKDYYTVFNNKKNSGNE